jgi:lysozyme family protein
MKENFPKILRFTLDHEGYKSEDPGGSMTIWGIASVYNPDDVKKMAEMPKVASMLYAQEIYHKKYWLEGGCDGMPWPWDVMVFDSMVNPGPKFALGPALNLGAWQDYLLGRIAYYNNKVREQPTKLKYLRGWIDRVLNLWSFVEAWEKTP